MLECSLIKRHKPKYNILLKDDKGYPYVRLNLDARYPRFSLTNRTAEDGARYFGPYGSRGNTDESPGRHRSGPPAAHLQAQVPPGHRQGAALSEPPPGQLRRLVPKARR